MISCTNNNVHEEFELIFYFMFAIDYKLILFFQIEVKSVCMHTVYKLYIMDYCLS